ncbi:sporulation protein [Bacillus lacus]|uniref:Sporulation protein n=1 Tax=Metabacillus lacus TaxID=1983721 RepID=A0A7X2J0L1_9BACI|nr:YhcN/YlaJ family sporulation lipoprotein [Metabacillus lacus]MRX73230.1 sporulation protein [Metabacillus lacus]
MKIYGLSSFIIGLTVLTGCQYGANHTEDLFEESGTTINVHDSSELYNEDGIANDDDGDTSNFGYVRVQKSPLANDKNEHKYYGIDREQLANIVSGLSVQLPNVKDIATLVTDEEILVAYESDTQNRFETADQVKKTAISVAPRYYHVYVSDDPRLIEEIEGYSYLDSNSRDIDQIINGTIKTMKKSPQGRKLNNGENPNGEGYGEMNEELDDDTKDGNRWE